VKTELYFESCVTGIPAHLKGGSVDVIITSPPYGIGIKYPYFKDTLSKEEYAKFTRDYLEAFKWVLKDDGSVFLNIGGKPSNPYIPFDFLGVAREAGWVLQNSIVWCKSITVDGVSSGHFKPINSDRYLNDNYEFVFHLTKTGNVRLDRLAIGVPYQDKSNVGRYGENDLRCGGNVWHLPYETIRSKEERPYPATYPLTLPLRCAKLHSVERIETAMDPFLGSGNTGLACKELGIPHFIGFDVDPVAITMACERMGLGLGSK
jgi:site-specific DNA-methyltransferase (adenine-specific)